MDALHGGDEELRGEIPRLDLVADCDVAESDVAVVADVVADPCIGLGRAGGEALEVLVGDTEGELDRRAPEGLQGGPVGAVEPHSADVVLAVESYDFACRQQVVAEKAVANSDLGV